MKKTLLCISLLTIFAAGFTGCNGPQKWNDEQRKSMRETLRDYRQMAYLSDLNDDEFLLFTDGVASQLEGDYPLYAAFIQMPGVNDTVDIVVIEHIVEELNADARNIRHIYPYPYLAAQGVLPAGLDYDQQHAFYKCFASKIDSAYSTMGQFFNAVVADTTRSSQIRQLETQCANDLFDWAFTEVVVLERAD